MKQDEIIEMANKAFDESSFTDAEVLRFAKLIASKEREACAKIVEESSLPDTYSEPCLLDIANEIRARAKNDY